MPLLQKQKGESPRKRSVEKYADDYTVEYYTDEKGREKKRAVYIGPYVKIYEDEKSLKYKLIGILIASLLVVAAVLWSHAGEHASAWWFGTVIPQVAALFPCLYIGFALPNLPFKDRKLQRDKYMNGLIRLLNCFGAIAAIMAVELVAEFIYRLIYKDWFFMSGDIIFLVKVVISIVFSVAAVIILRNIDVDETELGVERTNSNK